MTLLARISHRPDNEIRYSISKDTQKHVECASQPPHKGRGRLNLDIKDTNKPDMLSRTNKSEKKKHSHNLKGLHK